MTTTTTRRTAARAAEPWPTRREREGGVRTRPTGTGERPSGPRARRAPRHAAPDPVEAPPGGDPDVTDRLPVVVPAQRTAEVRPSPVPRAIPAPPRPTPAPRPPRPAVGSAVREVRPRVRTLRNGLGVAAACLGAVGVPLGLLPVTGFAAAGLGVLALAFGIAGWSRVRSGTASNRGTAVTGAVLGLIALGLGVAGTIAFVRAPDRLVYDLDALTSSSPTAVVVTPSGE
jgi:hypothetical protein